MKKTAFLIVCGAIVLIVLFFANRPQSVRRPPEGVLSRLEPQVSNAVPQKLPDAKSSAAQAKPIANSIASDAVNEYVKKIKADPGYDWKQPINFYGRVVDENNAPVVGANAHFVWNDTSATGTSEADTSSDANGTFSLLGKRGKRLLVSVSKDGFYSSGDARNASFEYANPADGLFTPDSMNPVLFHLRKKSVGANLIHGLKLFGCKIDGSTSYCDLVESKVSGTPTGDFSVQITRSEKNSDKKFNWKFKLIVPDGGLIESTDEFMFLAPDDGYQPSFEIGHNADDFDWRSQEKRKFYIKSRNGQFYSRVEVTIIPDYGDVAAYDLNWYLNPSGSKNLEPN